MPVFQYTCHACKGTFDEVGSSKADQCDIVCPWCSSKDTERIGESVLYSRQYCRYTGSGASS